jgi:hypothetical protein
VSGISSLSTYQENCTNAGADQDRVRGLDLPRADEQPYGDDHPPFEQSTANQPSSNEDNSPNNYVSPLTRLVVDLNQESEDEGDNNPAPPMDQTHYAANPLPFISGSNRPLSLRNLLDPAPQGARAPPLEKQPSAPKAGTGDLLAREVISLDMAHQLFSLCVSQWTSE